MTLETFIVAFLESLHNICNGSNDGGLSYQPFKVIVALKLLNLFSSQDVTNVHYFKKELKVKYEATKAICGKFFLRNCNSCKCDEELSY